jgi:hypothetical protein
VIPPLVLRIYADSTGVKKGVAQANAQVSGLRASVVKNANLIKTGLALGFAAGAAVAIKAASDLGEAQNKANVIFEDSVGIVNKLGEESASSFGIAKAEALGAASAYGAMFQAAGIAERASADMSVTMVKLAADMASFSNVDPAEMLEKLRGGLAGEAEPLRRFGVFISEARVETEALAMGMDFLGGKLTDAQKIQARYSIIMKDTAKAQGDFGRTLSTSLPNQLRVLKAELIDTAAALGEQLLPYALQAVRVLRAMVPPMVKLTPLVGAIGAGLGTWWALGKLGALAGVIGKTSTVLTGMGVAAYAAAGPLAALVAAVAVAAWGASIKPMEDYVGKLREIGVSAKEAKDRVYELGVTTTVTGREMSASAKGGIRPVTDAVEDMIAAEQIAADRAKGMGAQQQAYANTLKETAQEAREARGALTRFAHMTGKEQKVWAAEAVGNLGGVESAFENLAEKAKLSVDKILTAFHRQATALSDYRTNIQEVASRNIPDVVLQQLIDMGTDGAAIVQELAGANKRDFQRIVGEMQSVINKEKALEAALAGLRRQAQTPIVFTVAINTTGTGTGLDVRQRAAGGPVGAMRPYIVGERGPELFIPHQNGTIVSNDKLGGGVTVNVYGDVNDAEAFERKTVAALGRAARRAGGL